MLAKLFSFLDILLIEKLHGKWTVLGTPPPWAQKVFPSLCKSVSSPDEESLFLDNFLFDAGEIWSAGQEGSVNSGLWVENKEGQDYPLEAVALSIENRSVLIIRYLGEEYSRTQSFFQQAREEILAEEVLEEEVIRRTRQIRDREDEMVQRLISAVEFRDDNTGEHVRRISCYSSVLARYCGWPPGKVDDIRLASTMHDIGKVGIPDNILLKPGKLTNEEFETMKLHTSKGGAILKDSSIEVLKMARDIALAHHERWDGKGYPQGLKEHEIPHAARIVAVVDVFDALVSERPYKKAFSPGEARKIIEEGNGNHFDPHVAKAFLDHFDEFYKIFLVNCKEEVGN